MYIAKINFVSISIIACIALLLYSITMSAVYAQPGQEVINASLDLPFLLHINETAAIESENIVIKFLDVIEDSRCPSNAACIWQGQVKIMINIIKDDIDIGNFDLTVGPIEEHPSTTKFNTAKGTYTVELLRVDPYPDLDTELENSEYKSGLIVSKVK